MWTRAKLKEKAKEAFKKNYWCCVLVAFVLGLLVNGGSSSVSLPAGTSEVNINIGDIFGENSYHNDDYYHQENLVSSNNLELSSGVLGMGFVVISILFVIVLIVFVIGLALRIFVFAPIEVGGCRFFVENSFEKASANKLFFGFTNGHYKNVVYTMFLRELYTFLWSLLFVIPGIVKSYEYRMVSYLLADCPDMPKEDAFAISKELMMGHKWDAFVLDWSFFGWHVLSLFTCGILGIFWVNPYAQATSAELFLVLKNNYFSGQKTSFGEDAFKEETFSGEEF